MHKYSQMHNGDFFLLTFQKAMVSISSKIKRLHIGRKRLIVSSTILPRNDL